MESDEAANCQDVGGAITAPMRVPSSLIGRKASGMDQAALSKIANGCKSLEAYFTYCKDFLDLEQYPKLPEQDRAVIADFISGELLENVQWKYLFPTGSFECILNTTAGPETDEYTCSEYTVLKINFEQISCSKDVRRVWNAKVKSKIEEQLSSEKIRSVSKNSDSEDDGDEDARNESLELQSPIKQPSKRRTPTRRRSFEERDRRRSSSRASRSMSNEPPSKKQKELTSGGSTTVTPSKTRKKASKDSPSKKKTPAKKAAPASAQKRKPGRPKKESVSKTKEVVEAEDQTWEVRTILSRKKVSGKYQYLVQWAGLNPEGKPWDDTWEPHHNISEDLIRDYWASVDAKNSAQNGTPNNGDVDGKMSVQNLLNSEPQQPAA